MNSISVAASFVAGLASILSPCILPVAPAVMAGSVGSRLRPLAVVSGMFITFTLMGGALAALGVTSGASDEVLRAFFIGTIFAFGLVMVSPRLKSRFSAATSRVTGHARFSGDTGSVLGGFLLGLSLGVVWVPCLGPILGPILGLAASQETVLRGTMLLAVYSVGAAVPLLGLAYGGKAAAARLEAVKRRGKALERAAGAVLIATAVAMAVGLDRAVQTALLPYLPAV